MTVLVDYTILYMIAIVNISLNNVLYRFKKCCGFMRLLVVVDDFMWPNSCIIVFLYLALYHLLIDVHAYQFFMHLSCLFM